MLVLVRALAAVSRRFAVVIVVAAVVLTAVFGALAGQQEQDQSQEAFSPDNEQLRALEYSGEAFESTGEVPVQIVVTGDDVISPEGLATVDAIRRTIASEVPAEIISEVPGQGAVVSYLAPVEAAVAAGQLDPQSADDEAVDAAYEQGLQQLPPDTAPLVERLVAGEGTDPGTALLLLNLDRDAIVGDAEGDQATSQVVAAVENVSTALAELDAPLQTRAFAFELFFEPDEEFQSEVGRLFGAAALIIVVILLVVYLVSPRGETSRLQALRRASADMGLTLFTILASIIWMQGIGVLLGPDYLGVIGAFSPPTQIIPILLIGLGVDYAIHLTARYREEVAEGEAVDAAADRATTTVGIALVLATITTALGFLTNLTNPVPAIRDFGILAAVGIVVAFLLMLTFVPAVRRLLDRRAERKEALPREALASGSESRLSNTMARMSILAERTPIVVLAVTLALGGLGVYGLTQLSTEFSFADFVPDDSPLKETFVTLEEEFGGGFAERTTVLVRGDVATPEVHNATVEAISNLGATEGVTTIGGRAAAESPVSALFQVVSAAAPPGGAATGGSQEGGQDAGAGQGQPGQGPGQGGALQQEPAVSPQQAQQFLGFATQNGLQPDSFTFAPDGDVAAVYDRLLELVPDTAGTTLAKSDGEYVASQVVVQTRSSQVGAVELSEAIEEDFAPVESAGADVVPTSNEIVSEVIVNELRDSQVSSMVITLLAALVLLMVTFWFEERRPELGAITLAPVALVVLWVFGTMAATGIPFGPVTAMISALAIGIGVPYTIHITHRFTEDLHHEASLEDALKSTMRHTGGALAGSAFTTMAGFAILVTSSLPPFRQLGLVVAYAIGFSLLAAVIVLPSMLALWARWRMSRGLLREDELVSSAPR
ncbi:MAG: MMPL family transporter [Nitriliruptorales bacterium]|nr:MMPL family transporter [Nitriliruptorales bacterium]